MRESSYFAASLSSQLHTCNTKQPSNALILNNLRNPISAQLQKCGGKFFKTRKITKKRDFICVYHKKAVPLRRDYGYNSIY